MRVQYSLQMGRVMTRWLPVSRATPAEPSSPVPTRKQPRAPLHGSVKSQPWNFGFHQMADLLFLRQAQSAWNSFVSQQLNCIRVFVSFKVGRRHDWLFHWMTFIDRSSFLVLWFSWLHQDPQRDFSRKFEPRNSLNSSPPHRALRFHSGHMQDRFGTARYSGGGSGTRWVHSISHPDNFTGSWVSSQLF